MKRSVEKGREAVWVFAQVSGNEGWWVQAPAVATLDPNPLNCVHVLNEDKLRVFNHSILTVIFLDFGVDFQRFTQFWTVQSQVYSL